MIAELHEKAWRFRKDMANFFPTPNPHDSLLYAFTEAGEAVDAWLRLSRKDDVRASSKPANIKEELADCAFMLLTALGPVFTPAQEQLVDKPEFDVLIATIASAYSNPIHIVPAIMAIASYINLETELDKTLDKIRARAITNPVGRFPISSTFQDHKNRVPPSTYPGIDYACPMMTPVRAMMDGTIRAIKTDAGGIGVYVVSDKYMHYCAHLHSVTAKGRVKFGDVIALSDNTGHSTGPHLHWSLLVNNKLTDPATWLP